MDWTSTEPALAPEYVDRARSLAPAIAAAADETERERRVAASVMTALHGARMFRLLLPRSLEGAEIDHITYVRVIEEVAKADASTAWCLNQNNVCSVIAGYLEPTAAREIFGPDWWPYGVEANRHLLEHLIRYMDEQGLLARKVTVEEIFAPNAVGEFKI